MIDWYVRDPFKCTAHISICNIITIKEPLILITIHIAMIVSGSRELLPGSHMRHSCKANHGPTTFNMWLYHCKSSSFHLACSHSQYYARVLPLTLCLHTWSNLSCLRLTRAIWFSSVLTSSSRFHMMLAITSAS